MIKRLYVVKDTVTSEYGNPMPFINEASARRYFNNLCAQNKEVAGDLQLYFIGSYDTQKGIMVIESHESSLPIFIVGGINE